jgi:hypothetical protein
MKGVLLDVVGKHKENVLGGEDEETEGTDVDDQDEMPDGGQPTGEPDTQMDMEVDPMEGPTAAKQQQTKLKDLFAPREEEGP